MTKNLVIVESPAKARTIERYLGPGYQVLASYGHVRDLPENPGKNKLGVDVENDFKPEYVVSEDRRKQLQAITKEARTADAVYLATDLDREGEAIAWHVAEAAQVAPDKARRVTFCEITPDAIRDAFAHPRDIDHNLVDAQQTRRILDRLVGYTLSPLLWRKVRTGLSAGRVQSVAVRLVVEREREINAFVAREYWTIEALLASERGETFTAELAKIDGKNIDDAVMPAAPRRHRHRTARHAPAGQGAQAALEQAQPGTAVHHQHAAAGSQPPPWLQSQAHDARRAGPVRGSRHARGPRRTDHLHAHRFGEHGRRRQARRTRRDRRPFRAALRGRQGPQLSHQHQGRPGGARGRASDQLWRATQTRSPAR